MSCPVKIRRRVDVHQQEVGVPETSQLLPNVLDPGRPLQKPMHRPYAAVESATDKRAQRPIVRGAQWVGSTPVSRDHRHGIPSFETLQKISHHAPRQEGHITCGDEYVVEPRGGEAGFDASERSLSTRPLASDVPGALKPEVAAPDDEHFVAVA